MARGSRFGEREFAPRYCLMPIPVQAKNSDPVEQGSDKGTRVLLTNGSLKSAWTKEGDTSGRIDRGTLQTNNRTVSRAERSQRYSCSRDGGRPDGPRTRFEASVWKIPTLFRVKPDETPAR